MYFKMVVTHCLQTAAAVAATASMRKYVLWTAWWLQTVPVFNTDSSQG